MLVKKGQLVVRCDLRGVTGLFYPASADVPLGCQVIHAQVLATATDRGEMTIYMGNHLLSVLHGVSFRAANDPDLEDIILRRWSTRGKSLQQWLGEVRHLGGLLPDEFARLENIVNKAEVAG